MRKEQGLSRRALAALAETQPTTLRHFERGGARLSIVMLERFAAALGYEVELIKVCDDAWPEMLHLRRCF